jgi:hypothetical protein
VGTDQLGSSGSGIIWDHLVWNHLVSSWIIWKQLGSSRIIWVWDHLGSSGIIWAHLGSSEILLSGIIFFALEAHLHSKLNLPVHLIWQKCDTHHARMQHAQKNIWDHLGSSRIIWDHLGQSGIIWDYLGSSGIIWNHLRSSGIIWDHLGSSGIIWDHLGSSGIIWDHLVWDHLGASGIIWDHMGSSGIIWDHLGSSGIIWDHSGSVWWGGVGCVVGWLELDPAVLILHSENIILLVCWRRLNNLFYPLWIKCGSHAGEMGHFFKRLQPYHTCKMQRLAMLHDLAFSGPPSLEQWELSMQRIGEAMTISSKFLDGRICDLGAS